MRPKAQPENFTKREEAQPKRKFFAQKLSNLGPVLNKPMQLKNIPKGAWGESLQLLSNFL